MPPIQGAVKASISNQELNHHLQHQSAPTIIDVRSPMEYRAGHIPGAINIPFWATLFRHSRIDADPKALLVVTCSHGPRSKLARLLYGMVGFDNVVLLDGHMTGWKKAALPLHTECR